MDEVFESLEIHVQTLSSEDFKVFRDLPIKEKYLFSPYLDPSFPSHDLHTLESYFHRDKNSYLQLRLLSKATDNHL